ncbi:hypothetical protein [Nitrospira moscoviensis]|uniref:hypothetical protein n=1 Tax=Nitrospira moscoviensis TaxID=42253 RepID=UPI0011AE4B11|nr:hypothetical protein [Nitrospira moscoviensis]
MDAPASGMIARLLAWLPWISLLGTTTVLTLILRQAPPLPIQTDPQAAERVAEKMAQLQLAMEGGLPRTVTLNEAELNQWMRDNLAVAVAHQAQQAGISVPPGHEATIHEVQSALKDLRVALTGHQLRAYALFTLYGRDISPATGRRARNAGRHAAPETDGGKLGTLPIPSATLNQVVHQLFDSPQNRDHFQLPPQIASIRVENNRLVIATQ